ncbi:MAG TPA: hypothetical protein IAC52_02500 [Candidatus Enteromonas pullicola]|uniref:Lipoprotein n=1 Tax=Candidatus Alloenteromonas pullicola TaxID=2840784 RepID=A0A9D1LNH5_9FIRM|nr:hypothetical protein [Candidatus Enteromonas pullicola]
MNHKVICLFAALLPLSSCAVSTFPAKRFLTYADAKSFLLKKTSEKDGGSFIFDPEPILSRFYDLSVEEACVTDFIEFFARSKDGHRAMWNPALTIDYDVQADNGVFGLQVLIPNTVISPDYFSPEDEFVVYQGYGLWGIIKEGAGNSSDYEYSEEWYAQGLFFISITLKHPEMDIGWLDERMLDPLWGVVITEFASCWD